MAVSQTASALLTSQAVSRCRLSGLPIRGYAPSLRRGHQVLIVPNADPRVVCRCGELLATRVPYASAFASAARSFRSHEVDHVSRICQDCGSG